MQELYDAMWQEARSAFAQGAFDLDALMDDPRDMRRGLSLVIRPDGDALAGMTAMIARLQEVAGEQYLYPASDLHVTVLPIISCVEGLSLDDIDTQRQIDAIGDVVAEVLDSVDAFDLDFVGLTASPACIMACGHPCCATLTTLRDAIRRAVRVSGVRHSMDRRYVLRTAHVSLLRFRCEPRHLDALLALLDEYRQHTLGRCRCDNVELVFNDWYQRRGIVRELSRFRLV